MRLESIRTQGTTSGEVKIDQIIKIVQDNASQSINEVKIDE